MRRVLAALESAADRGQIVLLIEGQRFVPGARNTGLEQPRSVRDEWAVAARYASSLPLDMNTARLEDVGGDLAKEAVRAVLLLCARLPPLELRTDLQAFVERLRGCADPFDAVAWTQAANDVAIEMGRWPARGLMIADLRGIVDRCKELAGVEGNTIDAMHRILYIEREAVFARHIAAAQQTHPTVPIHIVVGVGHAAALVPDVVVASLGFDVGQFRADQAVMPPGPRLWDLVDCTVPTDPLAIPTF